MAELTNKKYLDMAGLQAYNTKLKEKIAADIKVVDDKVVENTGKINANTANIATAQEAANTAQAEVDALETIVSGLYTNEQIDEKIESVKTESSYDDTEIKADIQANTEAIAKLNGTAEVEGSVAKAVANAKAELEGKIQENTEAIEAHKTAIDSTVTTLVGEDAGKSVRKIANEELAAQLLSGEADADFQTLQELAAWLEGHPEDVATINLNIANLQALVGTIPEGATATDIVGYIAEAVAAEKTRAEGAEKGLSDRIDELSAAVGEGGSVDNQIDAKIAELDADVTSAAVEAGKGVQVQVIEVDGKITTVAVSGDYSNNYDAKGSAQTAETNAKDYTDTEIQSVYGAISSITTEEINALFA